MSPDPNLTPAAAAPPAALTVPELEAFLSKLRAGGTVNQANAATCIYGDSGTGKSTLCATAAEYCWRRYRKISRYYSADPGGFGNKLLRLIRLGIVQVYNPTNHIEPFATMEDISKGAWPETINDPYTGLADPQVKLILPVKTVIAVKCAAGHDVIVTENRRVLTNFSLQCPTCKGGVVTPKNWGGVEERVLRTPGTEHVGLYVFDSGTALSDWGMEDMANRAAANDPSAKSGNALDGTGARIISGNYAFGANTQQHYGFAQNGSKRWIKNSRLIPGVVMPAHWTFLVQRATDDNANVSVFGPKIAGNAATPQMPAWFGNCVHAEKVPGATGKETHRLWLTNHTAPNTNVPYLAKTRVEPGDLPPYLEDAAEDGVFSKFSMGYLFDQIEQALEKHAEEDVKDFPDAPVFQALPTSAAQAPVETKDLTAQVIAAQTTLVRPTITAPAAVVPPPPAGGVVARPAGVPSQPVAPVQTPAQTPAQAPAATQSIAQPAGRPPTPSAVAGRRPAGAPPPPAGARPPAGTKP